MEPSAIILAIFIILITLVFFTFYQRSRTNRQSVLLTGLCNSGKTSVFSQLTIGKHVQTFTSIKENIAPHTFANNGYLKIVDIPGHERLRAKFFDQHKLSARAIVFVVDSLNFQEDVKDIAEFLYNILYDEVVLKNKPNILILCNKQDQPLSKGSNAIKSLFEKELNTLQNIKLKQLESVDPADSKAKKKFSVVGGKSFSFTSQVEFAECFAYHKDGIRNIEQLTKWLVKIA